MSATFAYTALGVIALAISLLAAAAGFASRASERPRSGFWYLLRIAQVAVMIFVLYACVIYLTGRRADDSLHYLYVLLPVAASFLAELIRGSVAGHELGERLDPVSGNEPLSPAQLSERFAALNPAEQEWIGLAIIRREILIMSLACLINGFLIWRALATTAGLF